MLGRERFDDSAQQQFETSPRTWGILSEFRGIHPRLPGNERSKLRSRMLGALYEHYVAQHIMNNVSEESFILPPQNTFRYFENLYPDDEAITRDFGISTLKRTNVPDLIAFEERNGIKKPAAFFEITLGVSEEKACENKYFERKVYNFQKHKVAHPELFDQTELYFMIPQGAFVPKEIKKRADVHVIEMPFTWNDFRSYFHYSLRNQRRNQLAPAA